MKGGSLCGEVANGIAMPRAIGLVGKLWYQTFERVLNRVKQGGNKFRQMYGYKGIKPYLPDIVDELCRVNVWRCDRGLNHPIDNGFV
jgi:hypothetical protein